MTVQKFDLKRYRIHIRKKLLTPFDADGGPAAAVPSLLEQMPIAVLLVCRPIPPSQGSKECPSVLGHRILMKLVVTFNLVPENFH